MVSGAQRRGDVEMSHDLQMWMNKKSYRSVDKPQCSEKPPALIMFFLLMMVSALRHTPDRGGSDVELSSRLLL
ncbi:uncharacterized [Tachysurus ichikawai]